MDLEFSESFSSKCALPRGNHPRRLDATYGLIRVNFSSREHLSSSGLLLRIVAILAT